MLFACWKGDVKQLFSIDNTKKKKTKKNKNKNKLTNNTTNKTKQQTKQTKHQLQTDCPILWGLQSTKLSKKKWALHVLKSERDVSVGKNRDQNNFWSIVSRLWSNLSQDEK